jgi:hypothetical protein
MKIPSLMAVVGVPFLFFLGTIFSGCGRQATPEVQRGLVRQTARTKTPQKKTGEPTPIKRGKLG